jgi:DNA mismatch repair ATPase MutS
MKVHLMYKDRDFDLKAPLPWNEEALTQDLELDTLWEAMAGGDRFLFTVAKVALFTGFENDLETIRYRQAILQDCLKNPAIIREIYQIPIESMKNKHREWLGVFSTHPSGILNEARKLMEMFVDLMIRLRKIADEHADQFESEGFTRFFTMIQQELDDEYLASAQNHLEELKFNHGVLLSAELGMGNEGAQYLLHQSQNDKFNLVKRILPQKSPVYSFSVSSRDEHTGRALEEIRIRGINLVANALAQAADHIDSFFKLLQTELAFYVGCINLFEQIQSLQEPVAFAILGAAHERSHSFQGLYDICLAMTLKQKVVGNDLNAPNKDLVIITGANQGGKSTFLRSIGLAQLMMQAGMFVPADAFQANLCTGLCTHYKREEDSAMVSGKLDEELSRMSDIVDHLSPNSLMLFNESFAATNEREGSEIARQITHALLEEQIKVFFVTHLYEFGHGLYDQNMGNAIFLRAERKAGGERTFKLIEGEPLQTSYGIDVYHQVFKTEDEYQK